MGFNYGYEKKKFDSRWKRLEVEYCDAGMSEEQIAAMKEYDWAWFCSQRVFQNHTQPIPCEQYDEVCGQSQLFRKFASLSYQWDVDKCQRRMVKNLKRRPENDPNAGNIALVIYAGTLSAGQLSAGSSAGGTGWTPAFHRSLSR